MKIAVISIRVGRNYGGILQAYALQKVLNSLGHEAILLNMCSQQGSYNSRMTQYVKKFLYTLTKNKRFYLRDKSEEDKVYLSLQDFINNKIDIVDDVDISKLKEMDYNAYVVGSDQVWRPKYFGNNRIGVAFLDFAKTWKNVKRIAYAASFGTGEWEYDAQQTQHCKSCALMFDRISVRELRAVELCREHLKVTAELVLDPTLLLTRDDYLSLIHEGKTQENEGTLLTYLLDENFDKRKVIKTIESETKTKRFSVIHEKLPPYGKIPESIRGCSVPQWLKGFCEAGYVLTDSFHACVFSVIFHRPFVLYVNKDRGTSRFESFLSIIGLEGQMINSSDEFSIELFHGIDWDQVEKKLAKYKESSLDFLKSSLN